MSLLNHLFGNASEVNVDELKSEFKCDVDVKALQRILATYVLG